MFKFFKKSISDVPVETQPEIAPNETPRERFEREKMSRRAMLRSMGVMTGAAVITLVSSDDLARLAVSKLRENEATREIGDTLAKEFRSAGIAFAATPVPTADLIDPIISCAHLGPNSGNDNNRDCYDCSVALVSTPMDLNLAVIAVELGMGDQFSVPSARHNICQAQAEDSCKALHGSGRTAINDYVRCMLGGVCNDALVTALLGRITDALASGHYGA